jgi:hypothetical protein
VARRRGSIHPSIGRRVGQVTFSQARVLRLADAASAPAPITRSCTHARQRPVPGPPMRVASAACLAAGQPPPCALAAVAHLPRFYAAGVRGETRRQILSSLGPSFVNPAPRKAKSGPRTRPAQDPACSCVRDSASW